MTGSCKTVSLPRWVVSGTEFRKAVAILEAENRTDQVLRVVRPGIAGSYVSVSSVQEGPNPSREDRFYPTRELLLDNPEQSSADADEAHWGTWTVSLSSRSSLIPNSRRSYH